MVRAAIESWPNVFIVSPSNPGLGCLPLQLAGPVPASAVQDRWSAAHSGSYILLRWLILVGTGHSNRDDMPSPCCHSDNAVPPDRDMPSWHETAFRQP